MRSRIEQQPSWIARPITAVDLHVCTNRKDTSPFDECLFKVHIAASFLSPGLPCKQFSSEYSSLNIFQGLSHHPVSLMNVLSLSNQLPVQQLFVSCDRNEIQIQTDTILSLWKVFTRFFHFFRLYESYNTMPWSMILNLKRTTERETEKEASRHHWKQCSQNTVLPKYDDRTIRSLASSLDDCPLKELHCRFYSNNRFPAGRNTF